MKDAKRNLVALLTIYLIILIVKIGETCQEDLAFIAPEDEARQEQVFNNHVGYTVEDLIAECGVDSAFGGLQGIDY